VTLEWQGREASSGEDLPTGHDGKPVLAADEGQESRLRERRHLLGDERSGRFSHESLKGEYRMAGQKVIVTITDKHWLLPWPVVEVRLRELVL